MKMSDLDAEELCNIFSPFGRMHLTHILDNSYESIAEDIRKGVINLSCEAVIIVNLILPSKRGSETKSHRKLKANAAKILRDLGETEIKYEGFDFSDVYGETLKIRVECGHTDGIRFFRSLWTVKEFWVLRYPEEKMISKLYKFKINYDRMIEEYPEGWELLPKEKLNQFLSDESKSSRAQP